MQSTAQVDWATIFTSGQPAPVALPRPDEARK